MDFIKNYLDELKKAIDKIPVTSVKKVVNVLYDAYYNNKQIFIIGNGGSAALASHFACDLGKGTLQRAYDENEKRFKVISLTDNVPLLTAFSNDVGYDDVFAQQLKNLINEGDIVIVISGSGNSINIIKAVEVASRVGARTVGFLGFDGGKLKKMVDYYIHIRSNHYGRIEDIHSVLEHLICSYLGEIKKNSELGTTKKSERQN